MERYAESLEDTRAWLAVEVRGWGAVIVPAGEQAEVAATLARAWPTRPLVVIDPTNAHTWFTAVTDGAFVRFAPACAEPELREATIALNGQRDRIGALGVITLVVSKREFLALRQHAPDLVSVLGSMQRVPLIPGPTTAAARSETRAALAAYYRARFGRLDLRGFIRHEGEDTAFLVEDLYQELHVAERTVELRHYPGQPPEMRPQDTRLIARIESAPTPVVVVGAPGAGKSFFLRWCAMRGAQLDHFLGREAALPIFVPLAALARDIVDDGLESTIHAIVFEAGLPHAHAVWSAARDGAAIFLLDGLDECGPASAAVVAAIQRASATYPQSVWITTSRPAGLDGLAFAAERLDIAPLGGAQLTALLTRWCELYEVQRVGPGSAARGRADGVQLAADVAANPSLLALAANPLLATIIAIVHRAGVRLPDHRVELYDHIVKILVERWNHLRTGTTRASPPIRMQDAIRLLGPVALEMVASGRDGAIDEDSLRELLGKQLATGTVRGVESADSALAMFRGALGLLVEHAPGSYGFLHKTLVEFLAAHELVRTRTLEALTASGEAYGARWHEPILLGLGIIGSLQADDTRLAGVVQDLVGAARHATREVEVMLGGLLADDPALTPALAQQLCDTLVPAIWFRVYESGGRVYNYGVGRALTTRIARGPWRSLVAQALTREYGANGHRPLRGFQVDERWELAEQLVAIGVDIELALIESLLIAQFGPDGGPGFPIWHSDAEYIGRGVPDLEIETGLSFLSFLCTKDVFISPLVLVAANGRPNGWVELTTVEVGRLRIRFDGEPRIAKVSAFLWFHRMDEPQRTVLRLLDAWRAIAHRYPGGAQPPASFDEARDRYAPLWPPGAFRSHDPPDDLDHQADLEPPPDPVSDEPA